MPVQRKWNRMFVILAEDGTPDTLTLYYQDTLGDLVSPEKSSSARYVDLSLDAQKGLQTALGELITQVGTIPTPDIAKGLVAGDVASDVVA